MFTDLDKTLELVNTPKGAPNFMLALVLCCYTEFWGKLKDLKDLKPGAPATLAAENTHTKYFTIAGTCLGTGD